MYLFVGLSMLRDYMRRYTNVLKIKLVNHLTNHPVFRVIGSHKHSSVNAVTHLHDVKNSSELLNWYPALQTRTYDYSRVEISRIDLVRPPGAN